ncbi:hypothetical protein B0H11DRAFT_2242728 [Mycena galericulata]|nr:hypothetical protein B0H11DRAFT_2242728 [Mycena galericulata]
MPPGCLSPRCRYARPLAAGRSPTSYWVVLPGGWLSSLLTLGRPPHPHASGLPFSQLPLCSPVSRWPLAYIAHWVVPPARLSILALSLRSTSSYHAASLSRYRTDRPDPPRPRLLVHPPPTPGRPAVLPPTARTASCDKTKRAHHLHLSPAVPPPPPSTPPPAETRDDDETGPQPSCRTDGSPTGRIGRRPPELRPRSTSRRRSAAPLPFGRPLPCWLGCLLKLLSPSSSLSSAAHRFPRRRPPDGWVAHWTDRPRSAGTKTQVHLPPTFCRPAALWSTLSLLVGMSSSFRLHRRPLRRPPSPSTPPPVETSVEVRGTKTSSPPPPMLVRPAIPSPALALLARKTPKHRLAHLSLLRTPTIPLGAVPR